MSDHRKRRKSFNLPGHVHELTFSCYRRRQYLLSDEAKAIFLESLERARQTHGFLVWAYVIMPEHVHLLIRPPDEGYDISDILKSIKQPVGRIAINAAKLSGLEERFLVTPSSGTPKYCFWQVGGGYDRNITEIDEIWTAIRYIHNNPVKRGLVARREDYMWSSNNAYEGVEDVPFEVDKCELWIPS